MTDYLVNDIYSCVQGEGVQSGVAMVLLRLHGCAVGCPWCDTKHTWVVDPSKQTSTIEAALGESTHYACVSDEAILAYIQAHHPGPRWILLTGGEPAQYDLQSLVSTLHRGGYRVALETSGTEIGHLGAACDWVCVSPKINMPGGKVIRPEALAVADEIKHVVGKHQDIHALDQLLSGIPLKDAVQICLQPVSMSKTATALCLETVQQRGWRLSVQLHKYLDQR